MYIFKKIWEWVETYFTIKQIIGILGSSAIMSGIITGLTNFFLSLGIVEKIFIGIGITLLITLIVMWLWSRLKIRRKEKKARNKMWIEKNMPYLFELRLNLARINARVTTIANLLAKREVSYSTIEKCNKEYEQMVKNNMMFIQIKIAGNRES